MIFIATLLFHSVFLFVYYLYHHIEVCKITDFLFLMRISLIACFLCLLHNFKARPAVHVSSFYKRISMAPVNIITHSLVQISCIKNVNITDTKGSSLQNIIGIFKDHHSDVRHWSDPTKPVIFPTFFSFYIKFNRLQ